MWIDNDLKIKEHSFVYRYGMLQSFTDKSSNLVYHMAGTRKEDRLEYPKKKFEIQFWSLKLKYKEKKSILKIQK